MAEIVSNFELIFKPQSPSAPTGTDAVATVLQGYFLAISNLENETYEYLLEFISVDPSGATADVRVLDGNNIFLVDTPDGDNTVGRVRSLGGNTHRPSTGRIVLPPQGTALAVLLPQAFPIPAGRDSTPLTGPNFEVRGYVQIRLPTVASPSDGDAPAGLAQRAIRVAQSNGPVRVLVTPQYRATYTEADGTITDQTQSTVPTGSGAAVISIDPDTFFSDNLASVTDLSSIFDDIEPEERSALLGSLLGQLEGDEASMKAVNALLKAADAKVSIKSAK